MNLNTSTFRTHIPRKLRHFASIIREHQGLGSLLCVGTEAEMLRGRLMSDGLAPRMLAGGVGGEALDELVRLERAVRDGVRFQHVVVVGLLERLPAEEVPRALSALHHIAHESVFLVVDTIRRERDDYQTVEGRSWWEAACFDAGFRKHSAYYQVVPYEGIDVEDALLTIPLEVIDANLAERFSLAKLLKDRDLHMDMMRESGRRSDGHVFRYHFAAQYVPQNARVIDIACGMGYGSHLLGRMTFAKEVIGLDVNEDGLAYAKEMYASPNVRFGLANAENLAGIEENSIDLICSFETLEHLPRPDLFLREARRILKPGGRLIVSVPNDWSDETGEDPNPYHFHVYTWHSLIDQLREHFIVDEAFDQTAGGGYKLYDAPRSFHRRDVAAVKDGRDSEWAIVVAMKSPIVSDAPTYEESIYPYSAPPANLLEFARYYDNAWLVHSMVEAPYRLRSTSALNDLCSKVMESARFDSPDFGAALCVSGYRLLEREHDVDVAATWLVESMKYIALQSTNPHVLRWQVSLAFLAGELQMRAGRRDVAMECYRTCVQIGFERFHPMLASKVIGALRRLAVMALDDGDRERAKGYFAEAVAQLGRVLAYPLGDLIGRLDRPHSCNYFDLVLIVDSAMQCAVALSWLEQGYGDRAAFAKFLVDGGYRDAITRERMELFEIAELRLEEMTRLAHDRNELYATAEARLAEIQRLGQERAELYETAEARLAEIQRLGQERAELYETAERRLAELTEVVGVAESRLAEVRRLSGRVDELVRENASQGQQIELLNTEIRGLQRYLHVPVIGVALRALLRISRR
ncbi:methyltransferase domain-containing protein [Burkholderia latens]|uniref:class I SAM-dependent methyltransferase n=1 Tax=Burkholderia latens TaxID=488446 RepID=UPI0039A526DA